MKMLDGFVPCAAQRLSRRREVCRMELWIQVIQLASAIVKLVEQILVTATKAQGNRQKEEDR